MSRKWGVIASVALVGLAIALFVVVRDDGSDGGQPTPSTTAPDSRSNDGKAAGTATKQPPQIETIQFKNGEVVGGVRELSFESGERIEFTVRSDTADEVHLHGYDIAKEVPAGGEVTFDVPAEIEGVFEVELEELGIQLAEVRVSPA
jgi:hypothetical protein